MGLLKPERLIWLVRSPAINRTPPTLLRAFLFLCLVAGLLTPAQESTLAQTQSSSLKSEFIAPGIEHLQITRGFKSDKEATGPWFINVLRIDLSRAHLKIVHAMDEAVGLETVSSMATRYGALAAVNSGYFRTTGTFRGDSNGVEVLNGKILSEPNNGRAAIGLIERDAVQDPHEVRDDELLPGPEAGVNLGDRNGRPGEEVAGGVPALQRRELESRR